MSEFAWLIEAPGPRYLGTRKVGIDEFYWTPSATNAVRFMSEGQADGVMMAVRALNPPLFAFAATLGDARAVEHGWITAVEPSPPFVYHHADERDPQNGPAE